jgi:hypothetical protein
MDEVQMLDAQFVAAKQVIEALDYKAVPVSEYDALEKVRIATGDFIVFMDGIVTNEAKGKFAHREDFVQRELLKIEMIKAYSEWEATRRANGS